MILDFKKNLDAIIIKKNDKEKIIKFKKIGQKILRAKSTLSRKNLKQKKTVVRKFLMKVF